MNLLLLFRATPRIDRLDLTDLSGPTVAVHRRDAPRSWSRGRAGARLFPCWRTREGRGPRSRWAVTVCVTGHQFLGRQVKAPSGPAAVWLSVTVNIREGFRACAIRRPVFIWVTFGIQCGVARRLGSNGLGPQRQDVSAFPRVTALRFSGQDWQSVRIYASEQCPRQDSNLRSRLRRAWRHPALTSGNMPEETGLDTYRTRLRFQVG